jgi:hypothetical protein
VRVLPLLTGRGGSNGIKKRSEASEYSVEFEPPPRPLR